MSGAGVGFSLLPFPAVSQSSNGLQNCSLVWPPGQALPTFPEPHDLEAADLSSLSGDRQGLLVTLQGIVNRRRPRLYFYWGTDQTNQLWLPNLNVPYRNNSDPWSLIERYRPEINGAVVYDPNLPDTVNLATNLAGLKGGVIATAELAESLNLPVLDDLRGRFSHRLDAYRWALSELWPKLTNRMLTAISPTNTVSVPNVQWLTLLRAPGQVRDASNRAVYTADLSAFLGGEAVYVKYQDAFSIDGWGPSVSRVTVTADGQVIASFQPASAGEAPYLFDADSSQTTSGWRFADGNSYFIYKFTPPAGTRQLVLQTEMWNEYLVMATNTAPSIQVANPLFRDYIVAVNAPVFWLDPESADEAALLTEILETAQPDSPYLGWFPQGHEMTGVTLCGQHRVPVVAADFFYNGTVFSGARGKVKTRQSRARPPKLENKIYLTMTMVEGDNIQYNQHRMRSIWDDPGRGQVPLNWSISALLLDMAPTMLQYFQQTQTANDLLVAGPSGAGYTYPSNWPPQDLEGFIRRSGRYLARTGMNLLFAYNRNGNTDLPLSAEIADLYRREVHDLQGIFLNYQPESRISMIGGLPVATLLGVNDLASGRNQLAGIAQSWDGQGPLFVAAGMGSWNMTPTDVNTLANSLGPEFAIVRGDAFFRLYRSRAA
ncbi:MAG TPA: GxGYxYP domain-containing protein [Blastocatellia bacterium]|nr:GxGYxYP domain-containing protein [Blastocatellia bacterium]